MEKKQRDLIWALREMIDTQDEDSAFRCAANEEFMDALYAVVRDIIVDDAPAIAASDSDGTR